MTAAEMAQLEEALNAPDRQGDTFASIAQKPGRAAVTTTANAILEVVRSRARLRAAWMEQLWREGATSPEQGLAISPGEVRRILTHPEHELMQYASFLAAEESAELATRVREADEALWHNEFFERLIEHFGLDQPEQDLLSLLIAVELNPKLDRALAYLADDTRATRPTAWMAAELFGGNGARGPIPCSMKRLRQWRLALPAEGEQAWKVMSPWNLDEAVLASVVAEQWVEPSLEGKVRLVHAEETKSLPRLYPDLLAQMIAGVGPRLAQLESNTTKTCSDVIDVALAGPDGAGRETLAAQFAAALGAPLMVVHTAKLIAGTGNARDALVRDEMIRAVRLAQACGALLYWRDADSINAADWEEVRELARFSLRSARHAANGAQQESTATHPYVLPPLDKAQRAAVWAYYSSQPVSQLVTMQRLTPKEIKLAAMAGTEVAARDALRKAVPTQGELLHALACPYGWDDLVLPVEVKKTLECFESQVRLRWDVYEDWGFSRLTHLGMGISALFSGPSGTGKTMAAQVLARSLGMELYRVDLAGVVNKYIGETEKRLRDVFDACERSGALLFFDEADALFGSRMQVKDSHDRFANIEIDYLLQRIEQFDGIAILATNRKSDLDDAFLRRLRFVVDFLPPSKADRLLLWQKALPERAPDGEIIRGPIDFALLANELDVNGAQVKSIALGAAFLARQQGARIGMPHIEQSAQREFVKQGLRLKLPIGSDLL
jgi:SpoVK/Ycf46/Vps4 family AAA+-type ATPase